MKLHKNSRCGSRSCGWWLGSGWPGIFLDQTTDQFDESVFLPSAELTIEIIIIQSPQHPASKSVVFDPVHLPNESMCCIISTFIEKEVMPYLEGKTLFIIIAKPLSIHGQIRGLVFGMPIAFSTSIPEWTTQLLNMQILKLTIVMQGLILRDSRNPGMFSPHSRQLLQVLWCTLEPWKVQMMEMQRWCRRDSPVRIHVQRLPNQWQVSLWGLPIQPSN